MQMSIVPGLSNLSHPIQIRLEEDLYLSSTLEVTCNSSFQLAYRWRMYHCSSTICATSPIIMNSNLITTSNEYFLPARTLPLGLHQIELLVTMTIPSSTSIYQSRSIYLLITPSGINANLVPLGTSMITNGLGQDLNLNPGEYSIDLDDDHFNASVGNDLSCLSPVCLTHWIQGLDLRVLLSNLRCGLFSERTRPTVDHRWSSERSTKSVLSSESVG